MAGRSVYATYDGQVVAVGAQTRVVERKNPVTGELEKVTEYIGFGKYVVLRHVIDGKTKFSVYGHLSEQSVGVGGIVLAGDQVGVSGNTGTNGAHLHFEFRNSAGFDVTTGRFVGDYFPSSLEALDTAYSSPAKLIDGIDTAYGSSVEDYTYQLWVADEMRAAKWARMGY